MPGTYNALGVAPSGGKMEAFPPGDYHLRVTNAEAKTSRNGNDMVVVNFKVVDGPHDGRQVNYYNVTFLPKDKAGAGMALHFLKCIGEPYEGEVLVWNEKRWLGRLLKANLVITLDTKGRNWNTVDSVDIPDENYVNANNIRRAAADKGEEEVPF